jgi:hypothetical protein
MVERGILSDLCDASSWTFFGRGGMDLFFYYSRRQMSDR